MCLCEEGGRRERGRKTKKERNEKEVNINKFICKHTQTQTHAKKTQTQTDTKTNTWRTRACKANIIRACVHADWPENNDTVHERKNMCTVHHTVHNRRL